MDKTEQPEQWAVELLEAVHDASDMGSACGMVDCPQCKAAALVIQRAFEERERKLREALKRLTNERTLQTAIPDGPWTPEMVAKFQSKEVCLMRDLAAYALKETPHAPE